ncbi:MAG TPA: peptide ABC transporter substrate-binding protein [Roseiflexaceae bacterium]|nr:peptide ABC transporter substrate-binding protein [Roseiflexaceae bacterium]
MSTTMPSVVTALLLATAFVLAACGTAAPGAPTAAPPPATPTAAPLPTSRPGPLDTLRWSLEGISNLPSLDPARPQGIQSTTMINLVFSGLIRLDERLEVQPDGAESWEVSADGIVYTFKLRENLAFADGTQVTASDFVYSINRALAPETASFGAPSQLGRIVGAEDVVRGAAREVSGVRALDERTLEIALDTPLAYFLAQLSYPYTFVVPRALVESGADWERRAYGTGPFKLQEVRPGEAAVLAANEHYWGGVPQLARVVMPFSADSETAYQRYRAGELDIMGNRDNPVPPARIPEVQGTPDFRSAALLTTRYVGFNNRRPPFDKVEVRRAFAMAVDKAAIAEGPLGGTVIPAGRILPSGMLGTQFPVTPLAYDPDAARAELARAGFASGAGFPKVTISYAVEGDNGTVVEALRAAWQRHLGVAVEVAALPLDEFIRRLDVTYFAPESPESLDFYLSVWGADYPDPQNFLSQQLMSGTRNNNGHFSDADFDRLVAEADRLYDRAQIERRLQLYNQAEQIAIDKVGWLPLFYPRFNILLHPRVEGLKVTPNGLVAPDWTKVRVQ